MNPRFDRLIIMISTLLAIVLWIVVAMVPIVLLLIVFRLADKRQRRRSKHLRTAEDTEKK